MIAGCSVDPIDEGTLLVSVSATQSIASPSIPSIVTVTARNDTSDRVVWGQGSSGCQLSLSVLTSAGERHPADIRACTQDFVDQALAPGAARTETFEFTGEVVIDGLVVLLPAGDYRLVGNAGDKGESEAIGIVVAGG
ncbi:MAG: hypothetical protein HKN29_14590 [Rhodothermales bacterium]|nr:hypothetical protein [Rhodothermales bacterium]